MNKKILYVLGGVILSGSLLLSGASNVYANYPENYNGATASNGRVDVSSITYDGDIVSLNLKLKDLDHFAVENLHKLWFDLGESGNIDDHLNTTINIVDEEKGLVQFNFNINDLQEGKVYGTRLYTEDSFAAILLPDTTFNMENKKVSINNSGITVTELSNSSDKEQIKNEEIKNTIKNGNEVSESIKDQVTTKEKKEQKKSLPATSAVK